MFLLKLLYNRDKRYNLGDRVGLGKNYLVSEMLFV